MSKLGSSVVLALFALSSVALGACSSDDSGTTVDVALDDYTMTPSESSVEAGDISFKVKNNGEFVHEMVAVKAADASDLPTEKNGEVNEDEIAESDSLGEVEDVQPDSSKTLKLTLDPGKYVIFCNKVDGTTVHFKEGMHANFTVTAAKD